LSEKGEPPVPSTLQERAERANRVTWIGLFINVVLTAFKLAAGIIGSSQAMIADAIHSLSDFATDVVVLLGFSVIRKPADREHQYGHGKVETLITVIIGAALFLVGLRILWGGGEKVWRAFGGEILPAPGWIAFVAAVVSIVSKEWLYRYTVGVGRAINSQAVIANAWHHRSDAFSSIGAMLGIGGAIILGNRWSVLDPLAAVVVSYFILRVSVYIARTGIGDLLETSTGERTESEIMALIRKVPGIVSAHDMKTRRIGSTIAVDVHIEVSRALDITHAHEIATDVEESIRGVFGAETVVSVHMEPF
jgi:cation diffusion facilitator family transporter